MSDKPDWTKAPEEATHWDSDAEYFCHNKGWWLDCGQYVKDEYQSAWGTSRYHARPAKWPSERERLQNKPSWEGAPEWAEWLAQDSDGGWFWFIDRPVIYKFTFQPVKAAQGIQLASKGEVLGDWRDTLERRPEPITPPTHLNMRCIVRPIERKEWNGPEDGLPPVGIRVELHNDLGYDISYLQESIGAEVTVKAAFYSGYSDVPMAAIETDDKECGCFRVSMIRPILTEEDKAVEEMLVVTGCSGSDYAMRALYAAGYRKQEEPK
jgi:hypothetical protein